MDPELHARSATGSELVAEIAGSFGEVRLRVTGASMIPTVWPGDVIEVRQCCLTGLKPGQLVLYRRDETLIAHRIVRIDGDLLVTAGDALLDEDPPVREAEIIGQVVSLLRNGHLISPRQSLPMRIGSSIVRRSDFCLRMMLRLGRLIGRIRTRELSWSS